MALHDDISEADVAAATHSLFQRGSKALGEAQARPCGLCIAEPRLRGDHLGERCRKRLNDSRREYEESLARHLAGKVAAR